ncbi:hypothetical protein BDV95DRAFT_597973 [Massariosphaeria phaeospora]|uniref:Uncharacterized protein n=1 Tax=Massariosphaeria phaeospora TaxID=100035 RepID=A0A7C8M3Z8_9PLEO|nr:hypothetical protein BDV95DRAFT_597973 [Massariosphaeria phaeospora]
MGLHAEKGTKLLLELELVLVVVPSRASVSSALLRDGTWSCTKPKQGFKRSQGHLNTPRPGYPVPNSFSLMHLGTVGSCTPMEAVSTPRDNNFARILAVFADQSEGRVKSKSFLETAAFDGFHSCPLG